MGSSSLPRDDIGYYPSLGTDIGYYPSLGTDINRTLRTEAPRLNDYRLNCDSIQRRRRKEREKEEQ